MDILLVNANTVRPPVSPIGLEYTGEALLAAGLSTGVLDLAFEDDWRGALAGALGREPAVAGVSVRNTDDCCFATGRSFIPWIAGVVAEVKRQSRAAVLLGGVGFSIMPAALMRATAADAGIAGDSEEAAVAAARLLLAGEGITGLPGAVFRAGGEIVRNPPSYPDLDRLPVPRRNLFDNRRYQEEGGMVGVETKRGCSQKCVYCADPVAKGAAVRLRPPGTVAGEIRNLVGQGVSWFHMCDSEFNLPMAHAKDVCRALIESGLGEKIKWYCYCSPAPFDRELAALMARAGCAGINFGADSLCDSQLRRLGRPFKLADIKALTGILRAEGMNYMFDLLVGGPGETRSTVAETIDMAERLDVPLAGISMGVRVYPGTRMEKIAGGTDGAGIHRGSGSDDPVFYLSPELGGGAVQWLGEMVAGNPRFLLLSAAAEQQSYNYADDDRLSRLIKQGARGAYWDILRKAGNNTGY